MSLIGRLCLLFTFALLAVFAQAAVASASDDAGTLRLTPGRNAITWNGAEPYPIADFADTPIAQIHRWDTASQEWLSYVVGHDGGALPERHLLPRVQYALVAEAAFELKVSDPLAGINPHAELGLPGPPDDPLRFEAYWPNEDSPLEDLILLRPDDERLSVKAEVAGGNGKIEVYWLLDGRLNHHGPASDDVELLPGKHDDTRLTAVDGSGQAIVVNLPRVVKLPPLELPKMSYAVWTHLANPDSFSDAEVNASIRYIAEAGFDIVEFAPARWASTGHQHPDDGKNDWDARSFERAAGAVRAQGFMSFTAIIALPQWASQGDVTRHWRFYHVSSPVDPLQLQHHVGELARRYPEIRYWMLSHESNLQGFWWTLDPVLDVERIRAAALGIWYENPSAAIIAPGLAPAVEVDGVGSVTCNYWSGHRECAVDAENYLQALYDHDFARWVDVVAYHPTGSFDSAVEQTERVYSVMSRNGDGDTPLWATSVLIPSAQPGRHGFTPEQRAIEMVRTLKWMAQDERVTSAHIYNLRETYGDGGLFYGLVERDFVNGQPVPTPTWTAVVEFLRAQREKRSAGD